MSSSLKKRSMTSILKQSALEMKERQLPEKSGDDKIDIDSLIAKSTVFWFTCLDFTKMTEWPADPVIRIFRNYYALSGEGVELAKIQNLVRRLQVALEVEAESFSAFCKHFTQYTTKFPNRSQVVWRELKLSFCRQLAEGVLRIFNTSADGESLESRFNFKNNDRWLMSDEMKEIVDIVETASRDPYEVEFPNLNSCLTRLSVFAFLSHFHYSAAYRFRYTIFYSKILKISVSMSGNAVVGKNMALCLVGSTQFSEKKRRMLFSREVSKEEPFTDSDLGSLDTLIKNYQGSLKSSTVNMLDKEDKAKLATLYKFESDDDEDDEEDEET